MHTIWRVLRDPDDTDDALQEALAIIWKRLDKISRHPNPKALILKICIDTAYDTLRKRIKHRRQEDLKMMEAEMEGKESGIEDAILQKERRKEILGAIGSLPRNQAQAIILRIVQDESYATVAHAIGCSEATARTHVKRGRARLSELLAHLLTHPRREATQ